MNRIAKDALVLTAITLIAGICLTVVYSITKEPIRIAQQNAKNEAYQEVLEEAAEFDMLDIADAATILAAGGHKNMVLDEAAAGISADGDVIGYVFTITTHQGYGGDITCAVGILSDGTVNGIEMLSISETAGLGMKAKEPEFKDQYKGVKTDQFTYTKEKATAADQIDAITGATITTSAVTGGVNAAIWYFQNGVEGGSSHE